MKSAYRWVAIVVFGCSGATAQVPSIADIPTCLTGDKATTLQKRRAMLMSRRADLQRRAQESKANCGEVAEGSAQQRACSAVRTQFQRDIQDYARDVNEFNSSAAGLPCDEKFVYSDNALIGGTTWIGGYNVQSADPDILEKSREMLRQQLKLGGLPYNSIDLNRYNFVVGIAASTAAWKDLSTRVVFDELSNGNFSANYQTLYNNIRGRAFGELACHSNGAMVCLAALSNHQARAQRVVLYGPQLTRESLELWQGLLRDRKIDGLDIYVNENDPVPPFSIALGDLFQNVRSLDPLITLPGLKDAISSKAPAAKLHTFACSSEGNPVRCHGMNLYKIDRGCANASPTGTVPGTALPGKKGVFEPPPPC